MKIISVYFTTLFSFLFVFQHVKSQQASFSVTTITENGTFSPKHVLAIWIEDNSGNFIKTLKKNASQRAQYLYKWNSKSSGNVVDAITGATLNAHTTHNVQWNCTNYNRQSVPSGTYRFCVEYTDQHAQGPYISISFAVNNMVQNQPIPDQTYFKNLNISYLPAGTFAEIPVPENKIIAYPNPGKGEFRIRIPQDYGNDGIIMVYDLLGKKITEQVLNGSGEFPIDLSHAGKGFYLVKLKSPSGNSSLIISVN